MAAPCPSQPKSPTRNRMQHLLAPIHQSINHRTKPEVKPWAFFKLPLKKKEERGSKSFLRWATHPNQNTKMTGQALLNCTCRSPAALDKPCLPPSSLSGMTSEEKRKEEQKPLSCPRCNNEATILSCPQGPQCPSDLAEVSGAIQTAFTGTSGAIKRSVRACQTQGLSSPAPRPERPLSLWKKIPANLINESLISRLVNHKLTK